MAACLHIAGLTLWLTQESSGRMSTLCQKRTFKTTLGTHTLMLNMRAGHTPEKEADSWHQPANYYKGDTV